MSAKSYRNSDAATSNFSTDAAAFTTSLAGFSNSDEKDKLPAQNDGGDTPLLDAAEHEPIMALPGAVDGGNLGVSTKDAVEVESLNGKRGQMANYDHFLKFNEDYAYGLTIEDYVAPSNGEHRDVLGSVGTGGKDDKEKRQKTSAFKKELGVSSMDDYRDMLRKDFNFGGIVSKYGGGGAETEDEWQAVHDNGKPRFISDVVQRFYPGKNPKDPDVQICVDIAENIWSYATLGKDVTGNTDIGEMQGLLYVFDAQIRGQSNVNTKMSDDTFLLPGCDEDNPVYLPYGDAHHGRATTLTTRHLLADMTGKDDEPNPELKGYDESHLLLDNSGSMVTDEFNKLADILYAGEIDGQVALNSYSTDEQSMQHVGPEWGTLYGKDRAAAMLDQASKDVAEHGQGGLGDGNSGRLGGMKGTQTIVKDNDQGATMVEKGLKAAVTYLGKLPVLRGPAYKRRQLVLFTDEPDASPDSLARVQELATEKEVDVKLVYSFSSDKEAPTLEGGEVPDDQFAVIDLLAIPELLDSWKGARDDTEAVFWERVIEDQGLEVTKWADIGGE